MRALNGQQSKLIEAIDDLRDAGAALEQAVEMEIAARQDRQSAILDFNRCMRHVTERAQVVLNKRALVRARGET